MNEFESDWISLSQSQSAERVFLSESERRKQGVWIQHGRIQDGCNHQVKWEWMSEVFFCANGGNQWMSEVFFVQMVGTNLGKCEWVWEEKLRWLNPRWWNSRWLPSSSSVRMNEFESDWISLSQSFVQNGWIQDGRFQDGCHHQVESEWMSEGFFCANGGTQSWQVWVSLRGKLRWLNPTWQNSRWLPSSSCQNEWVWVRLN